MPADNVEPEASASQRQETGASTTIGWSVAYWLLWTAFLLAASLNMLDVAGGFLTNHLADLTVPALLYVVIRRRAGHERPSLLPLARWLGHTPERAALALFLASTATEATQIFWPAGLFAGRFDPWDIVAFGAGLLTCYGIDKLQQVRVTSRQDAHAAVEPDA